MSNVSDNLANASTTGFKTIGTNFSDLVSVDRSPDVGSGVRSTPAYYNNLQGAISTSSIETYLAVSGRGFFPVALADSTGAVSSSEVLYTRSGDFTLNSEGYLENSEGYNLMGWDVNPDTGTVSETLTPVQIASLMEDAVPTTQIYYEANLPASETVGYASSSNAVTIYDSAGESHEVSYSWEKIGTNLWELTVSAPDGGSPDFTGTAQFSFTTGGRIDTITNATGGLAVSGTDLTFTLNYSGAASMPLTASFGNVTQFADTTLTVSSFSQNGVGAGTFTSLSIDENGYLSLNYSNGVSRTYYEIPLAIFNAPEQLQREDGTAFHATDLSGAASYVAAGTDGAGKVIANALENSTVDIADQFTTMIKAQQAYSANAKMISTADSMLETLVSL